MFCLCVCACVYEEGVGGIAMSVMAKFRGLRPVLFCRFCFTPQLFAISITSAVHISRIPTVRMPGDKGKTASTCSSVLQAVVALQQLPPL